MTARPLARFLGLLGLCWRVRELGQLATLSLAVRLKRPHLPNVNSDEVARI